MKLVLTLVALIFVYTRISSLKKKEDELIEKEKTYTAQQQLSLQYQMLAAATGIMMPMMFNISQTEDPLGTLSKEYERTHRMISILWIAFYLIIALALYDLALPWLKILAKVGPKNFIHMLSL